MLSPFSGGHSRDAISRQALIASEKPLIYGRRAALFDTLSGVSLYRPKLARHFRQALYRASARPPPCARPRFRHFDDTTTMPPGAVAIT